MQPKQGSRDPNSYLMPIVQISQPTTAPIGQHPWSEKKKKKKKKNTGVRPIERQVDTGLRSILTCYILPMRDPQFIAAATTHIAPHLRPIRHGHLRIVLSALGLRKSTYVPLQNFLPSTTTKASGLFETIYVISFGQGILLMSERKGREDGLKWTFRSIALNVTKTCRNELKANQLEIVIHIPRTNPFIRE